MITGVHAMFYSSDPDATRAFLRDKLGLPYVGEGWLIFDLPAGDLGIHPADPAQGGAAGSSHISFFCADVKKTVAELKARGVEFIDEIADHGYGFVTHFRVPGGIEVQLYEPRYVKKAPGKPADKKAAVKKPAARRSAPKAKRRGKR